MFQTLQPKKIGLLGVAIAATMLTHALATTFVSSQTIKSGTRIACVLEGRLDSSKLAYGDKFKLEIVDTGFPALHSAWITGWITEVQQPTGSARAKLGFFLTTIHLPGGHKKSITAYIVNKGVVQYNPAAQYQQRQQLSPMAAVPNGTVTPGPIAWEMRLGSGPSSVKPAQSGTLGGYIYGMNAHEPIIVPAGTSVTVELAENLTIP